MTDTRTRAAGADRDTTNGRRLLLLAGACSFAAAALHLACLVGGPAWYRALGAGERMAALAAAGHWYPPASAAVIATLLAAWGAYAWSGAGALPRLPLLRTALCAIAAVYLLRGLGFPLLFPYFPGNSTAFWLVTSAICVVVGTLHAAGLHRAWPRLSGTPRPAP